MFNNGSLLTWVICLLALCFCPCSHFMLWSRVSFLLHINAAFFKIDFFFFLLMTSLSIYWADIRMASLICCMLLHSFTVSCTHWHTHTQLILPPSPFSIKKPPFDIRWTWWTGRALGTKLGLHMRRPLLGGHLHFSPCVFTDSDTISCSVWRAFDCKLGTEM